MSPVPIYREGENFFVPHFEVELAGTDLPDSVIRDVQQVTYRDSVADAGAQQGGGGGRNDQIDSFEITLNNWDAETQSFKYEPPSSGDYDGLFEPGKELWLRMGYFDNLRLMLKGQITTIEPNFTESGPATISIRGLNVLHKFRKRQHTWAWPDQEKDSNIALQLGQQRETRDRPGLGMRVVIDEQAVAGEQPEFVFMNNQYGIAFLLDRARRRGYALYLDQDEDGEFLYFGPSDQVRRVTYELEWGKSLTSFRPTLTTANQVGKVTVRGWDRNRHRALEGSAQIPDDCQTNNDQTAVAREVQGREEIITDRPVRSEADAKRMAKDILCNFRRDLVRGSGATVGLPDLRAGNRIVIRGLGPRFSGSYFVTSSSHTIGPNGYRTTFESRREGPEEAA
ncbi:MAG TPA: hypothetical protein VGD79_12100 [Thermoanaerobaculia bacterium]